MSALVGAVIIFGLRLIDVSLGTLRIQFLVQGRRRLAGVIAFFEAIVWTVAAVQVLGNLDEPIKILGYAGGYAAGTMLGSMVESRIGLGDRLIRVVAPLDSPPVAPALSGAGYSVTVINGEGTFGEVRVTFSVVPRRRVEHVMSLIGTANPEAFVTIDDSTRSTVGLPANALRK